MNAHVHWDRERAACLFTGSVRPCQDDLPLTRSANLNVALWQVCRVGQARLNERRPTICDVAEHGGPALASSLVPPYNYWPTSKAQHQKAQARTYNGCATSKFPIGLVWAGE